METIAKQRPSAGTFGFCRLLSGVCRRQALHRFAAIAARSCLVVAALFLVSLFAGRLLAVVPDIVPMWSIALVPVVALIVALVTHRRVPEEVAARLVDSHLDSQDLMLTAHRVSSSSDLQQQSAFSPLVIDKAESLAQKSDPAEILPFQWRAAYGWAMISVLVLVFAIGYTPQLDPFKKRAAMEIAGEMKKKLEETRQATAVQAKALQQAAPQKTDAAVQRELAELQKQLKEARPEMKDDVRRQLSERQKNMGQLWRQLSEAKLRDALSKSKASQRFGAQSEERKEFREMAERGDFGALRKQMDAIQQKLGELAKQPDSSEKRNEMDALKEKMQAMADAMAETMGSERLNDALSRALEQLDMSNLQDLAQQAMEAAQESMNLSQQELENLAKAMEQLQNLEQALSAAQMAKALNEMGELNGAEGAQELAGSLADYEQLFREMTGGMEPGQGMEPGGAGQGAGTGGAGQGKGGQPPENPDAQTDFVTEKSKSALQQGKILMNLQTKGQTESGEVAEEYREAIGALREAASEAILQEQIPPGYHESIRDYFDRMENETSGVGTGAAQP